MQSEADSLTDLDVLRLLNADAVEKRQQRHGKPSIDNGMLRFLGHRDRCVRNNVRNRHDRQASNRDETTDVYRRM